MKYLFKILLTTLILYLSLYGLTLEDKKQNRHILLKDLIYANTYKDASFSILSLSFLNDTELTDKEKLTLLNLQSNAYLDEYSDNRKQILIKRLTSQYNMCLKYANNDNDCINIQNDLNMVENYRYKMSSYCKRYMQKNDYTQNKKLNEFIKQDINYQCKRKYLDFSKYKNIDKLKFDNLLKIIDKSNIVLENNNNKTYDTLKIDTQRNNRQIYSLLNFLTMPFETQIKNDKKYRNKYDLDFVSKELLIYKIFDMNGIIIIGVINQKNQKSFLVDLFNILNKHIILKDIDDLKNLKKEFPKFEYKYFRVFEELHYILYQKRIYEYFLDNPNQLNQIEYTKDICINNTQTDDYIDNLKKLYKYNSYWHIKEELLLIPYKVNDCKSIIPNNYNSNSSFFKSLEIEPKCQKLDILDYQYKNTICSNGAFYYGSLYFDDYKKYENKNIDSISKKYLNIQQSLNILKMTNKLNGLQKSRFEAILLYDMVNTSLQLKRIDLASQHLSQYLDTILPFISFEYFSTNNGNKWINNYSKVSKYAYNFDNIEKFFALNYAIVDYLFQNNVKDKFKIIDNLYNQIKMLLNTNNRELKQYINITLSIFCTKVQYNMHSHSISDEKKLIQYHNLILKHINSLDNSKCFDEIAILGIENIRINQNHSKNKDILISIKNKVIIDSDSSNLCYKLDKYIKRIK